MAKTILQRGVGLGAGLDRLALLCRDAKNGDLGGKTARETPNRRGNQMNLAMGTQSKLDQQV